MPFKLLAVIFILGCSANSTQANQVCFKQTCFSVEIAKTTEERMRGLQKRQRLEKDAGMLFIFPKSQRHSFWMKDTLIPLDIIWLNYAGQVVHVANSVEPCTSDPCPSYKPDKKALYVLEINAGQAQELGMQLGEQLKLDVHYE